MCVAEDVRDPQGRTLIARGQRLGLHHIERLRKFHIEALFIDPRNGEAVVKPTKSELREECEKALQASFGNLQKEFKEKRVALDTAAIKAAANSLVDALMKSKNPLVTLLDVSTSSDRMMQHSVNAAILSTVLAIDLHVPEAMLHDMAVAMLCHDVGFIFLPDELLQKATPPVASEVAILRQHIQLGTEHLVRSEAISSVAANIVLRHHEALDGSGYPAGASGDKLPLLTRVANVVETYDSLTSPRLGIPAVLPDVALSYLLTHTGTKFAKDVVLALSKRIALYPEGIAVQLNTGEAGIVAGTLPKAPMRPTVLVQVDHRGNKLKDPMIVDLSQDTRRSIMRSAATLPELLAMRDRLEAPKPPDPVYASLG
ncbi:MAG TPA: HD domain-containing phosphohydrolase [Chthonomonadaceae bacterium]|nr:HD domain-containing phosphohydrolase [Chthonomonadaceae bacterium]